MKIEKRNTENGSSPCAWRMRFKFDGPLLIFPTQHVFILLGTTL